MNDGRLTRFKSFLKCNRYYDHYYNHDCVINCLKFKKVIVIERTNHFKSN